MKWPKEKEPKLKEKFEATLQFIFPFTFYNTLTRSYLGEHEVLMQHTTRKGLSQNVTGNAQRVLVLCKVSHHVMNTLLIYSKHGLIFFVLLFFSISTFNVVVTKSSSWGYLYLNGLYLINQCLTISVLGNLCVMTQEVRTKKYIDDLTQNAFEYFLSIAA